LLNCFNHGARSWRVRVDCVLILRV
jgi:hypothetical protein